MSAWGQFVAGSMVAGGEMALGGPVARGEGRAVTGRLVRSLEYYVSPHLALAGQLGLAGQLDTLPPGLVAAELVLVAPSRFGLHPTMRASVGTSADFLRGDFGGVWGGNFGFRTMLSDRLYLGFFWGYEASLPAPDQGSFLTGVGFGLAAEGPSP